MAKREEKSSIMLYIIMLFLVSFIPSMGLLQSGQSSGGIEIIGPEAGFILAVGIYFRWKYIDRLFYFIITAAIIADIYLFLKSNYSINFLLLSACHLALLVIFSFSEYIRKYIKGGYRY